VNAKSCLNLLRSYDCVENILRQDLVAQNNGEDPSIFDEPVCRYVVRPEVIDEPGHLEHIYVLISGPPNDGGGSPDAAELSIATRYYCRNFVREAEDIISNQGNTEISDLHAIWMLLHTSIFRGSIGYYYRMHEDERDALNTLISFYFGLISEQSSTCLFDQTECPSVFNEYNNSQTDLRVLVPARPCPNADEWEEHLLEVEGIEYQIPVFIPQGLFYPWEISAIAPAKQNDQLCT